MLVKLPLMSSLDWPEAFNELTVAKHHLPRSRQDCNRALSLKTNSEDFLRSTLTSIKCNFSFSSHLEITFAGLNVCHKLTMVMLFEAFTLPEALFGIFRQFAHINISFVFIGPGTYR